MLRLTKLSLLFLVSGLLFITPVSAAEDLGPRKMSPGLKEVETKDSYFGPDPQYDDKPYSPEAQYKIYGGKRALRTPRPIFELFRPLYSEGDYTNTSDAVGGTNLFEPQFTMFGDFRTAVAHNSNGENKDVTQIAARLNLNLDLKLTGTERIHATIQPIDSNGQFTRKEFGGADEDGTTTFLDLNLETLFFEGDVGSIVGGLAGEWSTFDLPFTFGLTPLLFQNGIYAEDAIVGGAASWAAKSSPSLGITNMDITGFFGIDKVTSPAAKNADGVLDDDDLAVFGLATFIEANTGYWEANWGFVEGDSTFEDIDYHTAMLAYSRRYGGWLSNSVRALYTFGQDRDGSAQQTADGFMLFAENSLITHLPSTLVPYFNFFYGQDRPQPLMDGTGLLKNTGINYETDGLTGFPKLDDSGHDSFGGAIGIQYLFSLNRQVVFEIASTQMLNGDDVPGRATVGDQYALGARFQQPISATWIVRADAMVGRLQNTDDVAGMRFELRKKF